LRRRRLEHSLASSKFISFARKREREHTQVVSSELGITPSIEMVRNWDFKHKSKATRT